MFLIKVIATMRNVVLFLGVPATGTSSVALVFSKLMTRRAVHVKGLVV